MTQSSRRPDGARGGLAAHDDARGEPATRAAAGPAGTGDGERSGRPQDGAGAVRPGRGAARPGLVAALLLAVAARVVVQLDVSAEPYTFAPIIDAEAYLLGALRVAAGADVSDEVYFQAPLYPWLLGGLLAARGVPGTVDAERVAELPAATRSDALAVARALNVACGLALVALVWRLGAVLFGGRAAAAAALLAALYGPFLFYEGFALKVSLSLLLLPWAVLAAARAERLGRASSYVWCGLALGVGGLVQGHLVPLVPAGAAALLARGGLGSARRARHGGGGRARAGWSDGWSGGARRAGALLLGAAVAMAPVAVRNSWVAGRPMLSGAQGGAAFWLCNNPDNPLGIAEHNRDVRQVPRHERDDFRLRTEQLAGRPLDAAEVSRFWAGRSLAWIASEPGAWLATEARKLAALASRYESPDNTGYFLGEDVSWLLAWTPSRFALVWPAALGGAWLAWRGRHGARPGSAALAFAAVGYAGVVLLFCVTSRYRMPLVPLLLVYAGALLGDLPAALRRPGRATLAAVVVLGALSTLVGELPFGPFPGAERARHRAVRHRNRALVALERGDLAAARADLERALIIAPSGLALATDLARLELTAAAAAREDGRPGVAQEHRAAGLAHLERAVALAPDSPAQWHAVATVAHDHGEHLLAVDALERATALAPDDPALSNDLSAARAELLAAGLAAYERGDDRAAAELLARWLASDVTHRDGGAEAPSADAVRTARQYLCLALLNLGPAAGEDGLDHAAEQARLLVADEPSHDDGHGLLALARLRQGRLAEARAALADYDRLAAAREAAGQPRRLPDLEELASLRTGP